MPTRRGAISLTNAIFLVILVAAIGTVLLVRGGNSATPEQAAGSDVVFQNVSTFSDAKQSAAEQDKLVFVLATADWCPPCRTFRAGTLADAGVQNELNRIAVPYKLDVTSNQLPPHDAELAANLKVSSIPALFVIDKDNNVLASAVGNMSESQFKSWLNAAEQASQNTSN